MSPGFVLFFFCSRILEMRERLPERCEQQKKQQPPDVSCWAACWQVLWGFSSCFSRFAVDVYGTAEKREKKRMRRKDNASLGMSASINTNQLAIHCLVTTESAAVPFRAPTAALKESLISCFQRCCPPPPPKPPDRHTHTNPHTNANTLSPLLLV